MLRISTSDECRFLQFLTGHTWETSCTPKTVQKNLNLITPKASLQLSVIGTLCRSTCGLTYKHTQQNIAERETDLVTV